MVCAPVRRDNPQALARGLSTYRRTNHALSHLYHGNQCNQCRLAHYGVSRDKDWVSVDCGTSL